MKDLLLDHQTMVTFYWIGLLLVGIFAATVGMLTRFWVGLTIAIVGVPIYWLFFGLPPS